MRTVHQADAWRSPPAARLVARHVRRRPCSESPAAELHDRRADLADHPHRPVRRAARRPAARLHAARRSRWKIICDLVAAIEDTAADLALPVMIEGYTPPHDLSLATFQGDARSRRDRGQLAASANWDELVDNTTTLYEEARRSRLGTEKFMLDGRHTGTGGGNHIVLGGADAGRQPLPPPARLAAQPGRLLEQPSVAVVSVLRPVRRPDEPGPAGRRSAARERLRTGNGLHARVARQGSMPAVAGRSRASATCWST